MADAERSLAYYATIQHAQWMLGADGVYLRAIRDHNSIKAAITMFRDYNVARTIWGKDGLTSLANSIMTCTNPWPDTLAERAKWCSDLAEKSDRGSSAGGSRKQGAPYSAVTKLCWFRYPEGWTMYDSFAQLGLSGQNGIEAFYRDLEEYGFSNKANELNQLIKDSGFTDLFGERIIDKFLMLRGIFWKEGIARLIQIRQELDHFVENLRNTHQIGKELAQALDVLAIDAAKLLPDDSFPTPYAVKKLKTRALQ